LFKPFECSDKNVARGLLLTLEAMLPAAPLGELKAWMLLQHLAVIAKELLLIALAYVSP